MKTPRRVSVRRWADWNIDQQTLWEMMTMWPNLYPSMHMYGMYLPTTREMY